MTDETTIKRDARGLPYRDMHVGPVSPGLQQMRDALDGNDSPMDDQSETTERWIECDCPNGADFDVWDIVSPDAVIHCSECGGEHRIGDIGQMLVATDGEVTGLTEAEWREAVLS